MPRPLPRLLTDRAAAGSLLVHRDQGWTPADKAQYSLGLTGGERSVIQDLLQYGSIELVHGNTHRTAVTTAVLRLFNRGWILPIRSSVTPSVSQWTWASPRAQYRAANKATMTSHGGSLVNLLAAQNRLGTRTLRATTPLVLAVLRWHFYGGFDGMHVITKTDGPVRVKITRPPGQHGTHSLDPYRSSNRTGPEAPDLGVGGQVRIETITRDGLRTVEDLTLTTESASEFLQTLRSIGEYLRQSPVNEVPRLDGPALAWVAACLHAAPDTDLVLTDAWLGDHPHIDPDVDPIPHDGAEVNFDTGALYPLGYPDTDFAHTLPYVTREALDLFEAPVFDDMDALAAWAEENLVFENGVCSGTLRDPLPEGGVEFRHPGTAPGPTSLPHLHTLRLNPHTGDLTQVVTNPDHLDTIDAHHMMWALRHPEVQHRCSALSTILDWAGPTTQISLRGWDRATADKVFAARTISRTVQHAEAGLDLNEHASWICLGVAAPLVVDMVAVVAEGVATWPTLLRIFSVNADRSPKKDLHEEQTLSSRRATALLDTIRSPR